MNIGLIGAILGSAIGIAGGLFGTYCSYRRAHSQRERRFVILASSAISVYVGLFLVVLFLFPQTRPMIVIAYVCILVAGVGYMIRRQSKIQREEQTR
jgi:uncharacterized membrane protein YfcA